MKRLLRVLTPFLLVLVPFAASAQIKLLPKCTATGDCGVTDIIAVLVNVAEFLLGISGAVALLFFVLGGIRYIISQGDKSKVQKATDTLKHAVTGIAIIFLAGVIVRFATQTLTGGVSLVPAVGESCDSTANPPKSVSPDDRKANGLWISIPPGLDEAGKVVQEGLKCVPLRNGCEELNNELKKRKRDDLATYTCKAVETASTCVRGLCSGGSGVACCQ